MNPARNNIGAFLKPVQAIEPQSTSTTVDSSAVNRLGYDSAVLHVLNGEATGSPSSYTVNAKIQDSADGSTGWADYTPPNGDAAIGEISADSTGASVNVDLTGAKKYVRVALTAAMTGGTSPKAVVAASLILGGADILPAA